MMYQVVHINSFYKLLSKSFMNKDSELKLDDVFQSISLEYFKNRFTEMMELGSGSGSNVFSAFDKQKDHEVAIKIYNKTQLRKQYQLDIIREVQILSKISIERSDYFVQFYHAYKIQKQFQQSDYCVVEEKCLRSLEGLLKTQEFRNQPQNQKLKLCLHISEGIQVLHNTHSIMHRDLKPANFLIAIRNGQQRPVLSDFGHSKEYQVDIANTTYRGSLKYVNPFILSSDESQVNYSFEFDVYSLGIVFLQILSNKFLFEISKLQSGSPIKFIKKMSHQLDNTTILLDKIQILSRQQKQIIHKCLTDIKYSAIQVVSDLKKIFQGEQAKLNLNKFTKNKHPQYVVQSQLKKDQTIYESEIKNERTTFQADSNSEEVQHKEMEVDEGISESQKMIISSCKVDSKINLKKTQKIFSDICISNINNEQEEETRQKSKISDVSSQPKPKLQKEKSLCLKRLQSVEQKLNVKIETSKVNKIPKAISTFWKISASLDENCRSLQELEKLRKFEKYFSKIKQMESLFKIGENDRKKIVIFGLAYMIKKIQNQCDGQKKDNSYTEKYTQSYLSKLREFKQQSIDNFLRDYGDKLGQKRKNLLKDQNASLEKIRLQFNNIAKGLEISEVYKQLKDILDK